jgi:hypothetical protein
MWELALGFVVPTADAETDTGVDRTHVVLSSTKNIEGDHAVVLGQDLPVISRSVYHVKHSSGFLLPLGRQVDNQCEPAVSVVIRVRPQKISRQHFVRTEVITPSEPQTGNGFKKNLKSGC